MIEVNVLRLFVLDLKKFVRYLLKPTNMLWFFEILFFESLRFLEIWVANIKSQILPQIQNEKTPSRFRLLYKQSNIVCNPISKSFTSESTKFNCLKTRQNANFLTGWIHPVRKIRRGKKTPTHSNFDLSRIELFSYQYVKPVGNAIYFLQNFRIDFEPIPRNLRSDLSKFFKFSESISNRFVEMLVQTFKKRSP